MRLASISFVLLALAGCSQPINVLEDDGGIRRADGAVTLTDGEVRSDAGDSDRDGGLADGSSDPVDAGPGHACIVDPFAQCEDPNEDPENPNNEWPDADFFWPRSVGCLTGDNLTPLDHTLSGFMCQTEPADFYQITLVGCDTRTMLGEIRATPHNSCPDDRWALELRYGGGCNSTSGLITCVREGEDRVIRVTMPPNRTVFSWYFAIISDFPDVQLGYDLQVTIR